MKLNPFLYLLIVGFIFSIFVFIGSIVFTIKTEENLARDFNDIETTHQIMNDFKKIAHLLENLETSYKSYLLSAHSDFLANFNDDEKLIYYEIDKLHTKFREKILEDDKLIVLKKLISERIQLAIIQIEKEKELKTSKNHFQYLSRESMLKVKIHKLISELISHQQTYLDRQHEGLLSKFEKTHNTITIVGISAGLLTFLIVIFLYQYNSIHIKIEKDLTQLNENKNKFFSIISHDLRGPVKNILLMSRLLYQEESKTIDPDKIAKLIETSSSNLSALLDNLLKWSRLQMNKLEFEPENIDLKKIVDDVINNIEVHAFQKNIQIKSNLEDSTMAFADHNMVATVIRNLISNALKFTEKGGMIIINAQYDKDAILISVEDTGVGMPQTIADKIFSIDFKHTTKGTNKEEGTGLGLKICKEFVEKNRGTIHVESQVGVGTNFIFSLPVNKA